VCEPSATPDSAFVQLPAPSAAVSPFELTPSKTSMLLPGSAVPATVTLPLVLKLPSSGSLRTGAAGAAVSTVQA
jgi:hypothetical protein